MMALSTLLFLLVVGIDAPAAAEVEGIRSNLVAFTRLSGSQNAN
jgi:hypothetical protein